MIDPKVEQQLRDIVGSMIHQAIREQLPAAVQNALRGGVSKLVANGAKQRIDEQMRIVDMLMDSHLKKIRKDVEALVMGKIQGSVKTFGMTVNRAVRDPLQTKIAELETRIAAVERRPDARIRKRYTKLVRDGEGEMQSSETSYLYDGEMEPDPADDAWPATRLTGVPNDG